MSRQLILDFHKKLIVDLFAGGGGMSLAFEKAFGRSPDIAVNHDDDALSMHRVNHPQTRHFVADVFEVCPISVTQGRPVGWLHGSPDCTHHSQAAGGQPRSKKIRGLGWVLPRWAGQVQPDVISMENVKQMLKWGPLVAKRDPETGRCLKRVVDANGKTTWAVADKGERVPVQDQYLIPDKKREGQTWRRFVATFDAKGYKWDYRIRTAANAGGHTTRTRLFFIARRDGQPIVFPEPKYFQAPAKNQKRWKAAADCIDFSRPCPSIFERKRPLAPATLKRIATGIKKFVLDKAKPFIVPLRGTSPSHKSAHSIDEPLSTVSSGGTHHALITPVLTECANASSPRCMPADEPLRTICAQTKGGHHALIAPTLIQAAHGEGKPDGVKRWGNGCKDINQPLGTITASGGHALATAYLMQANGGFNTTPGHGADEPFSTVTNSGSQQQLVTVTLSPEEESGALRVAAFLMRYYGEGGQWTDITDPMATITTKDRMALVTVTIAGTPYVIVDIGLRMLEPRELYRAQDFPESYIIDHGHDGRRFSKTAQVRMVGNSVNPVDAADFIEANAPWLSIKRAA